MAATVHFKTFHGRSAFEVRLRHPEGRAAGEAYLKQLSEFPNPFVNEKPARLHQMERGSFPLGPWANPETPQFPPGTAWALVRRAILADSTGLPVVSPLVESVQIRVYRTLDPQAEAQTFFEWEMRRALLLGKGGFHLTTPLDQFYSHFPEDQDSFRGFRRKQTSLNCYQCHSGFPGIHSVVSRSRMFEEQLARPPEFRPTNHATLDAITIDRARALPGWNLLRWLWSDQRP